MLHSFTARWNGQRPTKKDSSRSYFLSSSQVTWIPCFPKQDRVTSAGRDIQWRETMAGKPVARLGDPGSHGGNISTGSSPIFVNSTPVALVGDIYSCPIHGSNPITTGTPMFLGWERTLPMSVPKRHVERRLLLDHPTPSSVILVVLPPASSRSF